MGLARPKQLNSRRTTLTTKAKIPRVPSWHTDWFAHVEAMPRPVKAPLTADEMAYKAELLREIKEIAPFIRRETGIFNGSMDLEDAEKSHERAWEFLNGVLCLGKTYFDYMVSQTKTNQASPSAIEETALEEIPCASEEATLTEKKSKRKEVRRRVNKVRFLAAPFWSRDCLR